VPEALDEDAEGPITQRARITGQEHSAPDAALERPTPASSSDADVATPEARPSRSGRRGASRNSREDTLLSLPAPADRHELELVDRLEDVERQLDALTARVQRLETSAPVSTGQSSQRAWLVWLVFLVVLGISWRLFRG
jgi:hypothetical protein